MDLTIYTDGGSLNNPGPSAIAFAIYLNDKLFFKHSEKIGHSTNNFAEYTALVKALDKVKKLLLQQNLRFGGQKDIKKITLFSDSSLMINQLNGLFKVKNADIRELIMKARILENEIKVPIIYKNIPREQNCLVDSLIKLELTNF